MKPMQPEWRVYERNPNGLWDCVVCADEDTARTEASYIRRNRPGREVVLSVMAETIVETWTASDIHPRAVAND